MFKETPSNILSSDSYKFSHNLQYPPKTIYMYSYFESRGGRFDKTLFFGLQYYLKRFLTKAPTIEDLEEAREFSELHGVPFNYEGWKGIVELGYYPITIKAVQEGTILPTKNILFSVESTIPKFFWIVSWFETMLVRLWYPITIATNSWNIKQNILKYLELSSDDVSEIYFKLHDFGSRGVTSQEQAMIGGASHLVNFLGSDTVEGTWMANKYYDEKMSSFSIPASEHSTITMWKKVNESEAYRNMIKQYGSGNIFACVSDSYDIFNACDNIWGGTLKQQVLDMKATLVVRPDSGNALEVIPKILDILSNKFGYTTNTKGFKVLNKVRVIQGDGIDNQAVDDILKLVTDLGYSATNISFGSGGGLLQKNFDRDTNKFAFKCSSAIVDGEEVEVFKDPITDKGKKSKKGKLDLVLIDGKVRTVPFDSKYKNSSILKVVFEDGKLYNQTTLKEVRERANQPVLQQHTNWTDYPVDVY